MTAFLEKVARGIADADCNGESIRSVMRQASGLIGMAWDEESFMRDMQIVARAAVEAMREPDEAMIAEGSAERQHGRPGSVSTVSIYQAMIGAALGEA